MSISDDRRSAQRTHLHRTWTVCVDSHAFYHRLGRVLDYSSCGIRLTLDGASLIQPVQRLEIHHPGTGFSHGVRVVWSKQNHGKTIVGARLLEAAAWVSPIHSAANQRCATPSAVAAGRGLS